MLIKPRPGAAELPVLARRNMTMSAIAARGKGVLQMLMAFPLFLILTLIPWLLVAHASLLSFQFYDADRSHLGLACKIFAIVLAAVTALSTVWCLVAWLVMLVRAARGWEPRP
jgi:hypothetical protein